jgi:hypothetical protein
MKTLGRALGILVLLTAAGALLIKAGVYGYTLFLVFPVFLGSFTAWLAQAKTGWSSAGWGALGASVACLALFLLGWEGIYCIAMAVPLVAPLGAFGGYLYHFVQQRRIRQATSAIMLLLPLGTLGIDVTSQPPVFAVATSIEIATPPERVWPYVVSYAEMKEQPEWIFRNGIGYPQRVRMQGTGTSGTRYCDFSTGSFVEPIEVWDEPRMLRFRVTSSPAPMHELSFYSNVKPKHLHGYFMSKEGEFRLTDLGNGHTRVDGTSWYQHGMWPAQYWRWWSDAIIHKVHRRVLDHIRMLAESQPAAE